MVTRSFVQKILFIILLSSIGSVLSAKPVNTEQVRKVAETFLEAQNVRQEKQLKPLSVEAAEKLSRKEYTAADVQEIHGDDGELLAYVTELSPEGYIITAADDDIRPILGYSFKGSFPFEEAPQNVLLHLVQWDVEARLRALSFNSSQAENAAKSNNTLWSEYASTDSTVFATLSSATQWGPLIETNWHQSSHFNDKCPLQQPGKNYRCAVGCVATAMSQIINYWEYPPFLHFSSLPWPVGDAYTSYGTAGNIQIDGDAIDYNFPSFNNDLPGMPSLNTALSSIYYDQDPNEEAYLCFAAGIKSRMRYGPESGAGLSGSAYRSGFYYGSAEYGWDPTGVSWHLLWGPRVIENIQKGWPVQIGIFNLSYGITFGLYGFAPHSVVVDGYKSTGEFHINYGQAGIGDWWYFLPIIDTSTAPGPEHIRAYYDIINAVVLDICPYQGWNQWGADEKNSFRSPYAAPITNPPVDKWQVTSRAGWRMKGLVVGTGNKIYASCSWSVVGYAKPYILEIDQYGEKEDLIEIPEEGNASYPVQNKNGEIFIVVNRPGDHPGHIYKIEPWNPMPTIYFSEPHGRKFDLIGPKVDSAGWLYAYTLDNLYCIKPSGNYWTFSAPAGSWFFSGPPAIDVERNLVYISSYDISTDTAYLACLHRKTGVLACAKKVFPNVTRDIGTPSIGPDGTVYVGCEYTLYKFKAFPEIYALLEQWQMTPSPGISLAHPLTIAEDGTIYLYYWKSDPNCLVLAAINPANHNVNWEIPLSSAEDPNEYVNVKDLYAASNNVIVFFVRRQVLHDDDIEPWAEDSYVLYAYRDNGDSFEKLWQKDFGATGGLQAFGPGATIYVVPKQTGGEDTLYAISEGERGDPDGGGMGYTNNAAPLIPSNPGPPDEAQDVNSTVTLSWTCDDPEGHTRKYSVFVGKAGYDMIPVAKDISGTSFILERLKPGTAYAWKVTATDGQAVTEGPTWVFATKQPDPDLHKDGFVDFLDFSKLARRWLETCSGPGWCDGVDLDWSEKVALPDLQIIAEAWLEGIK